MRPDTIRILDPIVVAVCSTSNSNNDGSSSSSSGSDGWDKAEINIKNGQEDEQRGSVTCRTHIKKRIMSETKAEITGLGSARPNGNSWISCQLQLDQMTAEEKKEWVTVWA
uniref:Uncharacterized protein n=1 Tax=Setaria digitata TaxID=48799 RepID=A0A915PZ40_9BILA